jgi:hypothetical protein
VATAHRLRRDHLLDRLRLALDAQPEPTTGERGPLWLAEQALTIQELAGRLFGSPAPWFEARLVRLLVEGVLAWEALDEQETCRVDTGDAA